MKTIRQWLEELPEPYKTQAVNNTDPYDLDERKANSLSEAVISSFAWSESPEGFIYWDALYDSLVEKEAAL